jgi:hypothetical protein
LVDFIKIFSLTTIIAFHLLFLSTYAAINFDQLQSSASSTQTTATSSAPDGRPIPELQLRNAAAVYQTENMAISITVLILYSKVFKYFELSAGLSEFSRTLEGAAPHLYASATFPQHVFVTL